MQLCRHIVQRVVAPQPFLGFLRETSTLHSSPRFRAKQSAMDVLQTSESLDGRINPAVERNDRRTHAPVLPVLFSFPRSRQVIPTSSADFRIMVCTIDLPS